MVTQNLFSSENVVSKEANGKFQVIEYARDMSVSPSTSKLEYYAAKMNVNRRQLLITLDNQNVMLQAGAMQWISSQVQMAAGVKGVGDMLGKLASSAVTKESAVKPVYFGTGQVMCEPTYKHILLTDVAEWGGSIVLDDGLFLACDASLQHKVVARSNISSALLGREGLFNLSLNGQGVCALESIVPREELIEVELQNDVIKIDGNFAIAWSGSLEFTVEKSTKGIIGSAVSGEGFVNVYRGTGKIWMAPVMNSRAGAGVTNANENAAGGQTGTAAAKTNTTLDNVTKGAELAGNILGLFK